MGVFRGLSAGLSLQAFRGQVPIGINIPDFFFVPCRASRIGVLFFEIGLILRPFQPRRARMPTAGPEVARRISCLTRRMWITRRVFRRGLPGAGVSGLRGFARGGVPVKSNHVGPSTQFRGFWLQLAEGGVGRYLRATSECLSASAGSYRSMSSRNFRASRSPSA